jgi:NADH dehydrogenase FAD-containing subunit
MLSFYIHTWLRKAYIAVAGAGIAGIATAGELDIAYGNSKDVTILSCASRLVNSYGAF